MSTDALLEAARLIWPAPASVRVTGGGSTGGASRAAPVDADRTRSLVLLPSAANPKLAVPTHSRAAAAKVATSATAPGSLAASVRTRAMGLALGSGLGGRLLRDRLVVTLPPGATGLDDLLGELLHERVVVGLRVGPPRANRKPVLSVVTPDGRLVAYAKLGLNELTDRLVAAESAALTRLGAIDLGDVVVPEVLHAGRWQEHQLLVQSPLPVRRSKGAGVDLRLEAAMVVVSRAEGVTQAPLSAATWWTRTTRAADRLPEGESRSPLLAIGAALGEQADRVLPMGGWHGDWNPGNCSVVPGSVLVWDWERYETGVPLGFDGLHLRLQASIGAGATPRAAATALLTDAAVLLAPFGVLPADAGLVAQLYLWGLGVRYATDDQAKAGAAIGRLGEWLVPVLTTVKES